MLFIVTLSANISISVDASSIYNVATTRQQTSPFTIALMSLTFLIYRSNASPPETCRKNHLRSSSVATSLRRK